MKTNLYDTDFALWLEKQAIALKNRDINSLDWDNLVEEIESLGNRDKREINSLTYRLLSHLLFYCYWTDHRELYLNGWENEIDNFRNNLLALLESKTYYNYFLNQLEINYNKALKMANKKVERSKPYTLPSFPQNCPFTIEQILEEDFYGV
ncbi:DUF29 domain-containing protein [Crocosphaera sp.]|uniref:DUF29 domain-containing protein n=1 Tax=Crocosphaera sp. TaxID=2729996 RepID=UPI0026264A3C|nr:DUF29 domain-containing protein [Crocosphaera sp.]MDJ0578818.1 DUF29 domain-containing protein [Crocosphaera sp.]